jgi:hypothetical protein
MHLQLGHLELIRIAVRTNLLDLLAAPCQAVEILCFDDGVHLSHRVCECEFDCVGVGVGVRARACDSP